MFLLQGGGPREKQCTAWKKKQAELAKSNEAKGGSGTGPHALLLGDDADEDGWILMMNGD